MKLSRLVADYLAYRRALGGRFVTYGFVLRSFCRHLADPQLEQVTADAVRDFLFRGRVSLSTVALKRRALAGLYQYADARQYGKLPPPPALPAVPRSSFVPYIYSEDELRRLLGCGVSSLRRAQFPDRRLRFSSPAVDAVWCRTATGRSAETERCGC